MVQGLVKQRRADWQDLRLVARAGAPQRALLPAEKAGEDTFKLR